MASSSQSDIHSSIPTFETRTDLEYPGAPNHEGTRLPGMPHVASQYLMNDLLHTPYGMDYTPSPSLLPQPKRRYHHAFSDDHDVENLDPHTPRQAHSTAPPVVAGLETTKVEAIATQMSLSPSQRHQLLAFAKVGTRMPLAQLTTAVYALAEAMSIQSLVLQLVETQAKMSADLEGLRRQVCAGWTPNENLQLAILALVKHALAEGDHVRISKIWMDIETRVKHLSREWDLKEVVSNPMQWHKVCAIIKRQCTQGHEFARCMVLTHLPPPPHALIKLSHFSQIYASIATGGTGQDLEGFVYQFLSKHLTHGVPHDIPHVCVARCVVLRAVARNNMRFAELPEGETDKDVEPSDSASVKATRGRGHKPKGQTFWDLAEQELMRIQKDHQHDPMAYKNYIECLIEANRKANGHQRSTLSSHLSRADIWSEPTVPIVSADPAEHQETFSSALDME
ncbi:hypothetical protein JB92DRAFT_3123001 [Gautieria morchelliformis]|nr:hypothetical protein JB92DRAFT_3123001 [Gautieria morchelliformis]